MTIGYKDFFPEIVKADFFINDYESMSTTVARANAWLSTSDLRVITIETVILPNINNEKGASETSIRTSGDICFWHQLVRVWYEVPQAGA
jgi:hypothetical protein